MSIVIAFGCLLGVGLVLVSSPFLWPAGEGQRAPRSSPISFLRQRLALAGVGGLGVGGFIVVSLIIAVASGALAQAVIGIPVLSSSIAVIGLILPWNLIGWRANARRKAGRTVWPDLVDQLISAVRSGLALPEGVSALARSGPDSTRAAFVEFERDYRTSGLFAPCADRLKDRLADPVADRILETLKMAREVGGSELAGVLRALSASLREDAAIRAEVEARQSWVVGAARLGVAAPWIVLALLASRPEAAIAYNSPLGASVIVCGLVVSVVAYRVMIALGRLPQERRWFR